MGRLDDNWKEGKRFLPILSGEDEGFKKLFDEKLIELIEITMKDMVLHGK